EAIAHEELDLQVVGLWHDDADRRRIGDHARAPVETAYARRRNALARTGAADQRIHLAVVGERERPAHLQRTDRHALRRHLVFSKKFSKFYLIDRVSDASKG